MAWYVMFAMIKPDDGEVALMDCPTPSMATYINTAESFTIFDTPCRNVSTAPAAYTSKQADRALFDGADPHAQLMLITYVRLTSTKLLATGHDGGGGLGDGESVDGGGALVDGDGALVDGGGALLFDGGGGDDVAPNTSVGGGGASGIDGG